MNILLDILFAILISVGMSMAEHSKNTFLMLLGILDSGGLILLAISLYKGNLAISLLIIGFIIFVSILGIGIKKNWIKIE